ncbi:MAG: response regulator transcription factor [Bacilli bacterium]|jgi:two-component system response regulator VanR|nr:response regulator transcription factor [Bacilli bacterium]
MKRILFVDDDLKYVNIIKECLIANGYIVDVASNSVEALKYAKKRIYDLYLLDLYLDQFSGLQLAEFLRMNHSWANIVFLTNSDDDNDEIRCLRNGSADYLKKNMSINVMLERIGRSLSTVKREENMIRSAEIEVDLKSYMVYKFGELIPLTVSEVKILAILMSNNKTAISRQELIEALYGLPLNEINAELRIIDAHVKNIKRKLNITSIVSIRGVGYRFNE